MIARTQRKILFVDDERDWRDAVSASLSAAGFEVVTASDGSEAMARGTDPSLGLMIVDEDLAGESGSMLASFLRRNNPDVPAMLYTTTVRDAEVMPGLENQAAEQSLPKGSLEELILNVGCYFR